MEKEMFVNENYKYISKLVEKNIPALKENSNFNQNYTKLFDLIDEMNKELPIPYNEKFNEVINLTYLLEDYYFALAYSLGVKYGEHLKNL